VQLNDLIFNFFLWLGKKENIFGAKKSIALFYRRRKKYQEKEVCGRHSIPRGPQDRQLFNQK
jgi:hypothetical protein